jgi:hypothetical protein
MTNLIPPESKKQLVRLYFVRLISVWSLLWSASLLLAALLLYPSYLLITGISAAYVETAASVTERTEVYDSTVEDLNRSGQEAKAIVRANQESPLSDLLQDIWLVNGQGVEIASVKFGRSADGMAPIGLTGEAVNRQALALFRDRLDALPYVTEVNLPIGNLAENQDINFTISVSVNSDNL